MEDKLGIGKGHCASEWGGRETGKFLFTDEEVLALISAEREACAELVDGLSSGPYALSGREIVEAIRARDISETCAQFIRLRAHIDASKVEDYE